MSANAAVPAAVPRSRSGGAGMLFLGLGIGCVLCVMCSCAASVLAGMGAVPRWQCADLTGIPVEQSIAVVRNDRGPFAKVFVLKPGKGTFVNPTPDSIFLTVDNNRVSNCYIPLDKPQVVECGGVDRIVRI